MNYLHSLLPQCKAGLALTCGCGGLLRWVPPVPCACGFFDAHLSKPSHAGNPALERVPLEKSYRCGCRNASGSTIHNSSDHHHSAFLGYGNLVPLTFQGRMFCISYALFGVPLILITIADIGKFLSENIVWMFGRYQRAKRQHSETNADNVPLSTEGAPSRAKDQFIQFGLEHYISIPISLIISILLGYIAIGAIVLGLWEKWDFFSGFYFSFITMTTVGFGDIVPMKQQFFLFDLCYVVIGLAVTTMCIDLVGIQYIRKIHYFGRAIKDARYALVNVGGRMVHVPNLLRYASVLQQKYGHKKANRYKRGAYRPHDLTTIRFIDYSNVASMDSISDFLSNIFCKNKDSNSV